MITRSQRFAVPGILFLHTILLAWSAYVHSPVMSEVGHLPAGISHWEYGRFDLYRVNPPLVQMIAAIPVLWMNPATNWEHYGDDPLSRDEIFVGIDFVNANKERVWWLYTVARWACIPFSWIGAFVCYRWATELYGRASGLLAMTLWCFCPNILGNAALVMPDVPAAALAVAACYLFWRWLKNPTWTKALATGIILGLAELTKTTLLALYPLWIVFWLMYRRPSGGMLAAQFVISLYVLNLGYQFEGSSRPLGDYQFQSRTLATEQGQNRFSGTFLALFPIPLPANYVQGIDAQKVDFEEGKRSYLGGEWSDHGWWYFYLYCLAIKVPLGTWVIFILAIVASFKLAFSRDEAIVLLPAAVILLLVSCQSGFSIHFRYVLPILPFLFIGGSKALLYWRKLAAIALFWSVSSSIYYFPHSISYFNELIGGPNNGHWHLLDSGSAWGQDLLMLKEWYDGHPEARPVSAACLGIVDPRFAGIAFNMPQLGPVLPNTKNQPNLGPQPGWYAIDVNYLHGSLHSAFDGYGGLVSPSHDRLDLTYFLRFKPIAKAGYSIHIYYLDIQDANLVRKELGLPPIRGFNADYDENTVD